MLTLFAQSTPEGISSYLFTQGVLGVACIVLGIVCVKLYSKTEKLQSKIDELQEARRVDAVETRNEVTSLMPGISQSLLHISDKIEVVTSGRRKR